MRLWIIDNLQGVIIPQLEPIVESHFFFPFLSIFPFLFLPFLFPFYEIILEYSISPLPFICCINVTELSHFFHVYGLTDSWNMRLILCSLFPYISLPQHLIFFYHGLIESWTHMLFFHSSHSLRDVSQHLAISSIQNSELSNLWTFRLTCPPFHSNHSVQLYVITCTLFHFSRVIFNSIFMESTTNFIF
jgi:hypothetical protein